MKLVIFGDRRFVSAPADMPVAEALAKIEREYAIVKMVIEATSSYKEGKITQVISGKARGADTAGERWANEHGIPIDSHPALWEVYGLGAGPVRNKEMALLADLAIGFLSPGSKGTANMIATCRKLGVPVLVYHTDTGEVVIYK